MKCPHCSTEQGVLFVVNEQGHIKTIECNKCTKKFYVQDDPEIIRRREKLLAAKKSIDLELARLSRYQQIIYK